MKHITYILTTVFLTLTYPGLIAAQQKTPPKIEWQRSLGGSAPDIARSVQQTKDGGFIIGGCTYSNDFDVTAHIGGADYWIVKLTSIGVIEWQKCLGGSGYDDASDISQTYDGGYIVAGSSASMDGDVSRLYSIGKTDYWVVKLNDTGKVVWERTLGGSNSDLAYSVIQANDSGYIVAGASSSGDGVVSGNHGNDGVSDYWIAKLISPGILVGEKSLGGASPDEAYSIQQTMDGGFIVAGTSSSKDGDVTKNWGFWDYWIVKLSNEANIEWEKSFGGSGLDKAYAIQQTNDGGYIAVGESYSEDGDVTGHHDSWSSSDAWVVKMTETGDIQWQISLGGYHNDVACAIEQTTDGGYVVGCYGSSNDGNFTTPKDRPFSKDIWIVKLSTEGKIEWKMPLGGSQDDILSSIKETSDGGYIIAGTSGSNDGDLTVNHGDSNTPDFWIVKLSPEGTNTVESGSATTHNITITPNPAQTSATLTLDSDEAGACEVEIISVTGATLKQYSTHLAAGKQDISLTGLEALPSGMYEVLVKRSGYQTLQAKLIIEP